MSNMSYCRFENTERDLRDCQQALDAMMDGDGEGPLSEDYELPAAKRLAVVCLEIVQALAQYADADWRDVGPEVPPSKREEVLTSAVAAMNESAKEIEAEESEEER